jgi:hypothetical protein
MLAFAGPSLAELGEPACDVEIAACASAAVAPVVCVEKVTVALSDSMVAARVEMVDATLAARGIDGITRRQVRRALLEHSRSQAAHALAIRKAARVRQTTDI